LLVKIMRTRQSEEQAHYFRAFDFLSGPEKEAAAEEPAGVAGQVF
jgi:hypothetical protein